MWLGPPESQNRITDFFGDALPACSCARRIAGNDNPAIPANPLCKNHRRRPTRTRSDTEGEKRVRNGEPWDIWDVSNPYRQDERRGPKADSSHVTDQHVSMQYRP